MQCPCHRGPCLTISDRYAEIYELLPNSRGLRAKALHIIVLTQRRLMSTSCEMPSSWLRLAQVATYAGLFEGKQQRGMFKKGHKLSVMHPRHWKVLLACKAMLFSHTFRNSPGAPCRMLHRTVRGYS